MRKDMSKSNVDWRMAIFWNTSSCPIPIHPSIEDVIKNIKKALYDRSNSYNEANVRFNAFGSSIPDKAITDAFQRGDVTFELVEGKKANTILIRIWAAIFWFIYNNRRPCVIMVISDDRYLNPFLHRLFHHGHIVINVLPHKPDGSHPNAGHFVWEWCSVAEGCTLHGPQFKIPKKSSDDYMKQQEEHISNSVAIYWDIENCQVPNDVHPKDVTRNMLKCLQVDKRINGPVRKIICFADVSTKNINKDVKKFCISTGVNFQHVPGGANAADAADIALLDNLSWFIFYNPPPCTIILISGDGDFVHFLLQLRGIGYNVINVTPTNVSKKRREIGLSVWEWPSFAYGVSGDDDSPSFAHGVFGDGDGVSGDGDSPSFSHGVSGDGDFVPFLFQSGDGDGVSGDGDSVPFLLQSGDGDGVFGDGDFAHGVSGDGDSPSFAHGVSGDGDGVSRDGDFGDGVFGDGDSPSFAHGVSGDGNFVPFLLQSGDGDGVSRDDDFVPFLLQPTNVSKKRTFQRSVKKRTFQRSAKKLKSNLVAWLIWSDWRVAYWLIWCIWRIRSIGSGLALLMEYLILFLFFFNMSLERMSKKDRFQRLKLAHWLIWSVWSIWRVWSIGSGEYLILFLFFFNMSHQQMFQKLKLSGIEIGISRLKLHFWLISLGVA